MEEAVEHYACEHLCVCVSRVVLGITSYSVWAGRMKNAVWPIFFCHHVYLLKFTVTAVGIFFELFMYHLRVSESFCSCRHQWPLLPVVMIDRKQLWWRVRSYLIVQIMVHICILSDNCFQMKQWFYTNFGPDSNAFVQTFIVTGEKRMNEEIWEWIIML